MLHGPILLKEFEQCQAAMMSKTESEQRAFIMKEIIEHTILKKNATRLLVNMYNFVIVG